MGCNSFDVATYEGYPAVEAPLSVPKDITFIGEAMYITVQADHCIYKVDSDGFISTAIGECGSVGDVDDTIASGNARLRLPEGLTSDVNNSSNYFFVDQTPYTIGK